MFSNNETNHRATERLLKLEVIDGTKAKTSTGLVDTRLFTGGQNLYLKLDPQTMHWYFQYSSNGLLPESLKSRFTSFKMGLKFAEDYFAKRNIRITKVED